jgi:predicted kinase
MKELILLRGLPGSGKSTLARILAENEFPVLSVDDFFTDEKTERYNFEFDKNHLAYRRCEENTGAAMRRGAEKIFIHNTFTMDWEIEPYFKLAADNGYRVHVATVEKYHEGSNIHSVSVSQLQKMAEKYKVKLL